VNARTKIDDISSKPVVSAFNRRLRSTSRNGAGPLRAIAAGTRK
jgi:hypothetical protein